MATKALFLDIDGVIATPMSVRLNYLLGRGPERQWYDPVSLTYLARLVAATGAIVVLSSNWRSEFNSSNPYEQAIMKNLTDQLAAAGAPISDITPLLPGEFDRSNEIAAWLDEHPCNAYVIIDDLACFDARPDICNGHLVLVENSEGFRHHHYRAARAILNTQ